MSWIRAVWVENGKEVEGVLPSIWCEGSVSRWPLKNVLALAKANTPPSQNWMSFEMKKIKFSSGNKLVLFLFFQFSLNFIAVGCSFDIALIALMVTCWPIIAILSYSAFVVQLCNLS